MSEGYDSVARGTKAALPARPVRVGDRVRSRSWIKTEWPSGHEVTIVTPDGFGRTSAKRIDVARIDLPYWAHADGADISGLDWSPRTHDAPTSNACAACGRPSAYMLTVSPGDTRPCCCPHCESFLRGESATHRGTAPRTEEAKACGCAWGTSCDHENQHKEGRLLAAHPLAQRTNEALPRFSFDLPPNAPSDLQTHASAVESAINRGVLGRACGYPAPRTDSAAPDDGMLLKLRWLRDTVGVDIERMFARALKEKDGREQPQRSEPVPAATRHERGCLCPKCMVRVDVIIAAGRVLREAGQNAIVFGEGDRPFATISSSAIDELRDSLGGRGESVAIAKGEPPKRKESPSIDVDALPADHPLRIEVRALRQLAECADAAVTREWAFDGVQHMKKLRISVESWRTAMTSIAKKEPSLVGSKGT